MHTQSFKWRENAAFIMTSLAGYTLVLSDKDDNGRQPFNVHNPVGRKRAHTLYAKKSEEVL